MRLLALGAPAVPSAGPGLALVLAACLVASAVAVKKAQ
jgi:hypothetical protein